jgi:hypothetical protein
MSKKFLASLAESDITSKKAVKSGIGAKILSKFGWKEG